MSVKKACFFFCVVVLIISITNCNAGRRSVLAQTVSEQDGETNNILIAYFTTSNVVDRNLIDPSVDAATQASIVIPTMEIFAGYIHETIGGTLFSIETVRKYPVSSNELNALSYQERDANIRPELSTHVPNMTDYNTIFLCFPNWAGTIPMAVATFLEEYDFSGKTIIASITHFGSGFGNSIRDIQRLCPNSTVIQGFSGSGRNISGIKNDVVNWVNRL